MEINQDTLARIVDNLQDGLYFVDRERRITYWNKAAERITGYSAGETVGKFCSDHLLEHVDADGNSLCLSACPLSETIADGISRSSEVYLSHKDGHRIPVSVRTSTLDDGAGNVIGGIELFTDISSQSASRLRLRELERLAMVDELTQLPNRRCLEKELHSKFAERDRLHLPMGVLFIDVDRFKEINDRYGHETGDQVLSCIARTFAANSRPFDVYGRWGGEEFLGLLHVYSLTELQHIADRMRMLVGKSCVIKTDSKLKFTVSIGGTILRDGDTIESLIGRADSLLYDSKEAGRNRSTTG